MATQIRRVITLDETDADAVRFERFVRVPDANGGTERVLDTKTVAADTLFPDLGTLSVLPPRCRFQAEREGTAVFVIEDEPTVRTVRWETDAPIETYQEMRKRLARTRYQDRLEQTTFRLALPYLVRLYVFFQGSFQKLYLWHRTKPMENEQAELLFSNLPNCYAATGKVCLGGELITKDAPIGTLIAETERLFWGTSFSHDYLEGFVADAARIPELASPWEWEAASKLDPRFVLNVDWRTTDQTIGEVIRREINQFHAGRRARIFDMLVRQIQTADLYERREEAPEGSIKQSPAQAVVLGNLTLHVGDTIRVVKSLPGLRRGRSYRIEWFGRPHVLERAVKLDGVTEPIVLITNNQLLPGIRVANTTPSVVTIGDIRIAEGARIRFTDAELWPELHGAGYQTVRRVVRSATGVAQVMLNDLDGFLAISEGDGLAAGVHILQENPAADGSLPGDTFTLADGTVVRVGDYVIVNDYNGISFYRVHEFLALRTADRVHSLRLRSETGRIISFQFETLDGKWNAGGATLFGSEYECETLELPSGIVRRGSRVCIDGRGAYEVQAILKPLTGNPTRYLKIANSWRPADDRMSIVPEVTVTADEASLNGRVFKRGLLYVHATSGDVKTIASFERSGSEVHAVFSEGGRVRIFENGAPTTQLLGLVETKTRYGARTIARGDVLRLRVALDDLAAQSELRVSHIIPGTGDTTTQIVFGGNKAIDLERSSLRYFELRVRGKWQPIVRSAVTPPPRRTYRPGEGIEPGVKVKYLGGDNQTAYDFERARNSKTKIGTVRERHPNHRNRWWIKYDGAIGSWNEQHIAEQYLQGVDDAALPILKTPRYGATAMPDAETRCVNLGQRVGVDRNGREIKIGDRVRAFRFSENSADLARRLPTDHQYTVVHSGLDNSWGTVWLYLDAGRDIGQDMMLNTHGAQSIPEELRNDRSWWARLVWATTTDCEVVR